MIWKATQVNAVKRLPPADVEGGTLGGFVNFLKL